jgi:hypothetical protein
MKAHIEKNLGKAYYLRTATPTNLDGPVSKSLLWDFHQSPYKWRHSTGKVVSKAMDLGTLIHSAILEPNVPVEDIAAVSPYADFRTKAAQEWRDDQREMGKMIVTSEDIRTASCCEQVFSEEYAQRFAGFYDSEVAVFGEIGATQIKGMIDIVPDGLDLLVDLKTTATLGSQNEIMRMIASRGYHWQAALYLDLWNAASGENRKRFVFCFIETKEPFETAWIELSDSFIDLGRVGYMNALAQWQACAATDHWPKQHEGIVTIEKPAYL